MNTPQDVGLSAQWVSGSASVGKVRRHVPVQGLLEWAFGVERVGLDFDEFAPRPGMGIEARLMEQAQLGCRVDGGGWSARATDAEIVAAVVSGLPLAQGGRRMAVAVAELARARMVPDWMPGAVPRLVPVDWKRASRHGGALARTDVAGHWDEEKWIPNPKCHSSRIRRVKRHEVRFCPCRWSPSADRIAAARRFYLDWWGALLHLQAALKAVGLDEHVVTSDMPDLTPWRRD